MLKYTFLVIIIITLIYLYHENKVFKVTRYVLKSDKLKGLSKNIRIIVLADLHNHIYGNDNDRLIQAIEEENPDLILIAGDMIVAKPGKDMNVSISLMKRLANKYPVYYGIGNHEYRLKIYQEQYGDMYENYFNELKKLNIHILDNKHERITIHNTILNLYGIEIDKEYYKRFESNQLPDHYINSLIGNVKQKEYNILLAHNPKYFKAYAKWGADLTLSGHIHGGLIRLPFLGGVASPQIEFFPKYDAGIFEEAGKTMILSSGLGTHTINVRFNNRAELVSIMLLFTQ